MTPYEIGQRDAFQKFAGSGLGALIGGGLGIAGGNLIHPGLGGAIGGAIGTAGGAILGNQFSDENSTPVGSAVGGLVGAPVGVPVGGIAGGLGGALLGAGAGALLHHYGHGASLGKAMSSASGHLADGVDRLGRMTNHPSLQNAGYDVLHAVDNLDPQHIVTALGAVGGMGVGAALGAPTGAFLGARTGHRIADKHNEKKQRRADEGLMADINKQDDAPAEGGA